MANQIKIVLKTCNLHTGRFMNYKSVKLVLIEIAIPEWQNGSYIKCQKLFTFANGYTGTPPLTLFFETLKNRVSRKPCC